MLRTHRTKSASTCKKSTTNKDGVVEPDTRIVFAVLAVGMIVGAFLTTPSKEHATVEAPVVQTASR